MYARACAAEHAWAGVQARGDLMLMMPLTALMLDNDATHFPAERIHVIRFMHRSSKRAPTINTGASQLSSSQRESDSDALVVRIRDGDRAAFDDLVRTHYAALCTFVRRVVDSSAVAEEIVQDVLMAVWERRRKLDPARSIKAYLYTSAHNRARNYLKHVRLVGRWEREAALRGAGSRHATEEDVAYNRLVAALQSAIEALPERCRLAFTLSRQSGLSNAEIAEVMGISVRTVDTQITKALKILRAELSDFIDKP